MLAKQRGLNFSGFEHRFTVVRDAGQKLVAVVEPATMPTSFILDGTDKVRFLHNGFHGEDTRKEYISEIESLLK